MAAWNQLNGSQYVTEAQLNAWRIVEDQSKSTTRKFVNSTEEHDLLEELIEQSKPKVKYNQGIMYGKNLHYLLSTPFRYPPLKWGSRFGTRLERGILYASLDLITAMSEKAFYKMAFLNASEGKLGAKTISYTAFEIYIESTNFANLSTAPFNEFETAISSKTSYHVSQAIGTEMRNDNIECFQYTSARSHQKSFNVGVFSPEALSKNNNLPQTFQHLNCYATKEVIEFSCRQHYENPKYVFPLEMFLVDGRIPLPPN